MERKTAFAPHIEGYELTLATKNYSKWTIKRRVRSLKSFAEWCEQTGLEGPEDISKPILERYVRYQYYYRKKDGQPLSFRTQSNHISVVRLFFKWLVRDNILGANPASELELPRVGQSLPRHVLSKSEVEAVLSIPDIGTDAGARDRAILETLYSTGIRRSELTHLDRFDLDIGRALITVRAGKGNKDRIIPIGERTLDWIDRYLIEVRPQWLVDTKEDALFVSQYGERLSADALSARVTKYVDEADIGKKGSCHLFRHTMATLMLEGGADVRFVQQMLGQASLKATQIYTHVSIQQLKKIHELTHPSARRGRLADDESSES